MRRRSTWTRTSGNETGCTRSSRSHRSTDTPSNSINSTLEGILAFAERVLPRASDLWVQASLNQKQRLQQLFFPDGIAFDGKRFVRTAVTTHALNYLTCVDGSENQVASPEGFEPSISALKGPRVGPLHHGDR